MEIVAGEFRKGQVRALAGFCSGQVVHLAPGVTGWSSLAVGRSSA